MVTPDTAERSAIAEATVLGTSSPQDYSPMGLFAEDHGDFLARKDRFEPAFRGSFQMLPNVGLDGDPGDFDVYDFNAEGMAPIVVDPDTVLLVGGKGESRVYDFSSNFRGVADETLYTAGLNIGAGHFFTPETYVEAVFKPGVYSDFDGTLTSKDWQWLGHVLGTYQYSEDLYLKGGIEVSNVFDDFGVYPLLGFASLFHPNWRADVLLPREAEISYLWDAATSFSLGLSLDGEQYRARSSAAAGKQQFDFQWQQLLLYLDATHRLDDHLSVFGKFGAIIGGDQKFKTPTGAAVEGQAEPALMFEVGVGWDF